MRVKYNHYVNILTYNNYAYRCSLNDYNTLFLTAYKNTHNEEKK